MAFANAYYGASAVDTRLPAERSLARVVSAGAAPVPSSDAEPSAPAPAAGLTPELREQAVREFLAEVGFSEDNLTSLREMVVYTRGRCGL